ncbi:zinc finger protein ZAT9-like [Phragmites australis]|uniref:zinc finger protein ZAT9-like n=1 Tax=Phragmites australis TaxID=29695 RepID=UPI002D76FE15|nr:zinc finger protein ZAT9-like [Phragmites australis]
MASSSRRRHRDMDDDHEEGEYVSGGYESSDTDDDHRYVVQSRGEEGHSEDRRGLPSPTSSCESDRTIGDDGNPSPSSVVAAPVRALDCHICGKEFGSPKAVDGHMRVHDPQGRHGQQQGNKMKRVVAVNGGWASTGKRGWIGGKAVSRNAEPNYSMAIVVAEPTHPLEPMPMASARINLLNSGERSSAQPIHNDESTAIVVAGVNPSTEAVVHQSAAPPPAAQQVQVVHQPSPPPAAEQHQLVYQPAAPRREYSCKECGKSFPTHQGLGGHAAGHMNRRKEAEAAAAAAGILQDGSVIPAACRRGTESEKRHECKKCHEVFDKGVALGGHMRSHYTGPPIGYRKKKRCLAPPVVVLAPPPAPVAEGVADLKRALSIKEGEPSPAPAVTSRVRLFGVDIGPQVQAPSEQQGSDTTVGTPSEQQGSSTTVGTPSEQQCSGTAEGSSSAGGQQ